MLFSLVVFFEHIFLTQAAAVPSNPRVNCPFFPPELNNPDNFFKVDWGELKRSEWARTYKLVEVAALGLKLVQHDVVGSVQLILRESSGQLRPPPAEADGVEPFNGLHSLLVDWMVGESKTGCAGQKTSFGLEKDHGKIFAELYESAQGVEWELLPDLKAIDLAVPAANRPRSSNFYLSSPKTRLVNDWSHGTGVDHLPTEIPHIFPHFS